MAHIFVLLKPFDTSPLLATRGAQGSKHTNKVYKNFNPGLRKHPNQPRKVTCLAEPSHDKAKNLH